MRLSSIHRAPIHPGRLVRRAARGWRDESGEGWVPCTRVAAEAGAAKAPEIMSDGELAVDVVIPVRNGARYIASCLDSVIAQTMTVRSAIVVDDGSTDDTAEIVEDYMRRWPAMRLIRTCQRGLPHARNTGIANCRSPYVAFLDSDDIWEASK